jgi:hypothetical protein
MPRGRRSNLLVDVEARLYLPDLPLFSRLVATLRHGQAVGPMTRAVGYGDSLGT